MTREKRCAEHFGLSFHIEFGQIIEYRGWKSESRPAEEYELQMWYALLDLIPEEDEAPTPG